jgi:DNA-binding XRE family transcriptional regulator
MGKGRSGTTNALEIIDRLLHKGNPARQRQLAEMEANDEVGRKVSELRTTAGLSQAELGKLIGASTPVIRAVEDGDYEGNSLAVLRRVAKALHKRVEIRCLPMGRSA